MINYPEEFNYGDTEYTRETTTSSRSTKMLGEYVYICDSSSPPKKNEWKKDTKFHDYLRKKQWRQEQFGKGK